jgi:ribosome-binding factor A
VAKIRLVNDKIEMIHTFFHLCIGTTEGRGGFKRNYITMASTRQLKYAKLIQKELSDIFQRDKRGILDNAFITIAEVRVSADLSVAKVYISMMLAKDKPAILERLNDRKRELRGALGEKIGKQVRVIPELIFYIDEVEEKAMRMDELIRNLNIPPADQSSDQ